MSDTTETTTTETHTIHMEECSIEVRRDSGNQPYAEIRNGDELAAHLSGNEVREFIRFWEQYA